MKTQNSTWNRQTGGAWANAGVVFTMLATGILAIGTLTGCGGGDGGRSGPPGPDLEYEKAMKDPISDSRATKLLRLIPKCKKAGLTSLVEKCFSSAVDACDQIRDNDKRADMFIRLAKTQVKYKKSDAADDSLGKAKAAVAKIESARDKITAMASIAGVYNSIDKKQGLKCVTQAEKMMNDVAAPSQRTQLLGDIAKAYHSLGKADEATRMTTEMEKKAAELTEPSKAVDLFIAIAAVHNALGNKDAAWKSCRDAKAKAAKIKIPGSQAIMLCEIAEQAYKAGHKQDVRKILVEAKKLSEDSRQPPEMMEDAIRRYRATKEKLKV